MGAPEANRGKGGADGGHSPREGAVRSGRGRRGGRNALKREMAALLGAGNIGVPPWGQSAAEWALPARMGAMGGDARAAPRGGRGLSGGTATRNAFKREMAALLGAEGIVAPPRGRWAAKGAFPGLPGAMGAIDGGGHRADGIAPMAAGAALRAHADTRAPSVRPRPTRAHRAPAPYLNNFFYFFLNPHWYTTCNPMGAPCTVGAPRLSGTRGVPALRHGTPRKGWCTEVSRGFLRPRVYARA